MIVLGLTGSIGMGKSTTSALLRRLGVPVHDADAAVHALLARGGNAVNSVLRAFPETEDGFGGIDRSHLGRQVFEDTEALRRLEAILHPLVRERERRFRAACARRRVPIAVLDVPLLFETGGDRRCEAVIVVTAPGFLQRQRVVSRKGVGADRFHEILRHQMPDAEKRRRARFVVRTGIGRRPALRQLVHILAGLGHGVDRGSRRCLCSSLPRRRRGDRP